MLRQIQDEAGVSLQFLTGEQEARLTYSAVRHWYGWQVGHLLNIDIGGGSMELAFGRNVSADVAVSLPLGAGESPGHSWPSKPSRTRLTEELAQACARPSPRDSRWISWEGQPRRIVLTSKTFKQMARLRCPETEHGTFYATQVGDGDLADCVARLARMPVDERARLRGVSPSRAGQILGGAVVALETLRCLQVEEADLSPWALREGIILEHLAALTDTRHLPLQPLVPGVKQLDGQATVTALARFRR